MVLSPYLLRDAQAHCFQPVEKRTEAPHEDMRQAAGVRAYSRANGTGGRPGRHGRPKPPTTATATPGRSNGPWRRPTPIGVERRPRRATIAPLLLPHWHPNQLRHSAATKVRKLFNLEAAQVVLGHAKADVTQVYAERDSALAVEVMKRIG